MFSPVFRSAPIIKVVFRSDVKVCQLSSRHHADPQLDGEPAATPATADPTNPPFNQVRPQALVCRQLMLPQYFWSRTLPKQEQLVTRLLIPCKMMVNSCQWRSWGALMILVLIALIVVPMLLLLY